MPDTPRIGARRAAIVGYVAALHAAVLVTLLAPTFPARMLRAAGVPVPYPDPPMLRVAREAHEQMDALIPAGAVLLLGDSLVMGMPAPAVSPAAVNLGIGGQTTAHLADSLPLYGAMHRASAVVVLAGINDVARGELATLPARYRRILAGIPPGPRVVMVGTTPAPAYPDSQVRAAGQAAREACATDSRCRFVDGYAALEGVPLAYRPDGTHLTPIGYRALISAIRPALE